MICKGPYINDTALLTMQSFQLVAYSTILWLLLKTYKDYIRGACYVFLMCYLGIMILQLVTNAVLANFNNKDQ